MMNTLELERPEVERPEIGGIADDAVTIISVEAPARAPFITLPPKRTAPVEVEHNQLLDRAVMLSVSFSRLGVTRRVRECGIDKDADRDLVRVSKRLFDCAELDAIVQFDGRVKAYLVEKCLPSGVRGGVSFLPIVSVEEVDRRLRHFTVERAELVGEFAAVYPTLLEGAQGRLRELFVASDYPPQAEVATHFRLEWNFVSMNVPGVLNTINAELFEQERQKQAERWVEAHSEIQTLLRVRLKSLVEHLRERLTPDAEGKSKVFRNSLVGNIGQFLAEFPALNITNDQDLEAVVEQARALLDGVDADDLRRVPEVRDTVLAGFEDLEQSLDSMLVDRPMRSISFDDV